MNDLAVPDDVLLAFQAQQPLFLGASETVAVQELPPGDDLGADEPLLDVAVDLAGSDEGAGALFQRPGLGLVLAHGKERDQVHQGVAGLDEVVAQVMVVRQPVFLLELGPLLRCQLQEFLLDLAGEQHGAFPVRHRGGEPGEGLHGVLVGVDQVEQGLRREELEAAHQQVLLFREGVFAQGLARFQERLQLLQQVEFLLQLLGLHFPDVQGQLFQPLVHGQEVGRFQLVLHGGDVAGRVDGPLGVEDLRVMEAPHQVDQAVGAAQQVDEGRIFHFPEGDGPGVQEFDLGVHRRRLEKIGQLFQPRVGDVDDGLVELVAGRGKLGYLFLLLGEQVEQQRLAGLGVAEYGEDHGLIIAHKAAPVNQKPGCPACARFHLTSCNL